MSSYNANTAAAAAAGGGGGGGNSRNTSPTSPLVHFDGTGNTKGLLVTPSFELDLIDAYEEVIRVVAASSRPGTARRDIADRVSEYSESLLAVLDRLQGATHPEWKCFRALALQLLAVARRFAEITIKIEGDYTAKTPWGQKVAHMSVDIIAAGCPLPFNTAAVGNIAAHILKKNPGNSPAPTVLGMDEVMDYVDAMVFAACELYCNAIKRYASLCHDRSMQRKQLEAAVYSSVEFYSAGQSSTDELFVLHCAFENDDTLARFWARRFGATTLSVPSAELVNGIDGEVFAGPDRVRRAVVEVGVSNSFDVHTDGMIDVGAVAVTALAVNKAVFPSVLDMIEHAVKAPSNAGNNGAVDQFQQPRECERCSRLEAELALERRKNAELRAEIQQRPKSSYLMTQLDAAHRTIQALQQQLGLNSRSEVMSGRDAAAESNRLRRAVLGAGLEQKRQNEQQQQLQNQYQSPKYDKSTIFSSENIMSKTRGY